jgi:hypothetical protein
MTFINFQFSDYMMQCEFENHTKNSTYKMLHRHKSCEKLLLSKIQFFRYKTLIDSTQSRKITFFKEQQRIYKTLYVFLRLHMLFVQAI